MWIWYVDAIQKGGLESRRQAKWEEQQIVLMVEKLTGWKITGSMMEAKEGVSMIKQLWVGDLPN